MCNCEIFVANRCSILARGWGAYKLQTLPGWKISKHCRPRSLHLLVSGIFSLLIVNILCSMHHSLVHIFSLFIMWYFLWSWLILISVPGKYIGSGGSDADHDSAADCITCLPGSYANYVAYKDRHNRLQYYAGTTSTYIPASSCKKCPGGTWQSSEQSGSCTSCVAGRYLPNGFSFSDHINISQCLPCTVGKSQNAVASTGCKNCLKGKKQLISWQVFFSSKKNSKTHSFSWQVYIRMKLPWLYAKGAT